ncbi:hypothetical protein THRCLA_03566 [Thraustotheca clavata]|uniref:Uncharacterized protein n=1 Tax=Thraustotheca clavata TaxID=74557 RepID=A0A1W0A1N0_9STRA|nr:hypothetical protein THRCLA_03566 [Thraustotheca clavata]
MGHLLMTGMAWRSRYTNVASAFPSFVNISTSDEVYLALRSVETAWVFALLSFLVCFCGLLRGYSGYIEIANVLQIVLHFAGSMMVSRFILEELHYIYLW